MQLTGDRKMNEIITALGFAFRTWDGRGKDNPNPTPPLWNVYLFLGLAFILGVYNGTGSISHFQALGIYAVVLTYILSGYKSMTLPWVWYHITKFNLNEDLKIYRETTLRVLSNTEYFDDGYDMCKRKEQEIEELTKDYEKNNGFHTWHMSYRYVIAGCMICAILNTWSVPYLVACSVAGLLFPLRVRFWNTEASARLTEGVLGAVIIGGWTWLV